MGSFVAKQAFYPPPRGRYSEDHAPIVVETTKGEAVRAHEAVYEGSRFTILMSHGNADDLGGGSVEWAHHLCNQLNSNIVLYDYCGYGLSEGTPSEASVYRSINAVYEYILTHHNRAPQQIILWGTSLGSGPTVDLASRTPDLGGMILQSPLTSACRVVFQSWPTFWFDIFTNIDKIKKVNCPVFIMHGSHDDVVPFAHGQILYSIAGEKRFPPLWLEGGHHNDLEMRFGELMIQSVAEFISTLEDM